MNKNDEYWHWTSMAISEPESSNKKYYYDIESDKLFGLHSNGNEYTPIFRNFYTQNNDTMKSFKMEISRLQEFNKNIISLPKIEFEKKKSFLTKFASNIGDEFSTLKSELSIAAADFSSNDEFAFITNLKDKSPFLYFNFQVQQGVFLTEQVEELLSPFGISENSSIIW